MTEEGQCYCVIIGTTKERFMVLMNYVKMKLWRHKLITLHEFIQYKFITEVELIYHIIEC